MKSYWMMSRCSRFLLWLLASVYDTRKALFFLFFSMPERQLLSGRTAERHVGPSFLQPQQRGGKRALQNFEAATKTKKKKEAHPSSFFLFKAGAWKRKGVERRETQKKKDEQTSVHLSGSKTESVSFSPSPCVIRVFASLCFPFFFLFFNPFWYCFFISAHT